ncbi:cation:proton antiporter [Anaerorhabdus furcosa]|uniref:Kef-type K+ transport system, membrane component KefB n=1 Tax=Anaerorhabdus furcosa TaxID=118967 RepID=A0A1T4MES4_9FIRM|nr:cation:proton antiporter [Anaerorhabdus furcosa]SJZ65391.1 Kef-type K+ transport system, membrane component KefB [Anaerorhabdus furcosa]
MESINETTLILCSLSIILFAGFLGTRMTKLVSLPNVSGYILAGVFIGPSLMNLVPLSLLNHMGFINDIALGFIAFGVGKFFKKEVIKATGLKVIVITCFEALLAGLLVTFAMRYLFNLSWNFSLILGAIATATAPASTMMTIRQYHVKGDYVNTLLQIVALDDVICLLTFSVVVAYINASTLGSVEIQEIMLPILLNAASWVLGILSAITLSKLLKHRSTDNKLILTLAFLLAISGICAQFDVSPLLSCMIFGAVYINITKDKKIFDQVNSFNPPIMSLFFIVSGMRLDVMALMSAGLIGVGYFAIRIIGKYAGTAMGCRLTGMPTTYQKYMGLAMIPQAGVAIGLAFLAERLLPAEMGSLLLTIILSSSVLYEMVGPACAKLSFIFAGLIEPTHSVAHHHRKVIES